MDGASIREEKCIESVVPGYNELPGTPCCHKEVSILQLMTKLIFEIGSTEIAHEMESSLPTKFQAIEHSSTISEIDADPPRKRPDA